MPWNFGQFEDVSLDAALYLLYKAELSDTARSLPTAVFRTLSAMVRGKKNCSLSWIGPSFFTVITS